MTQSIAGPESMLIPNHPSEAAYLELLHEISALGEAELVPINIDALTAVTTVLGALPGIRALRPQIEAEWRSFNFERFDKLEAYVRARAQPRPRALAWRFGAEGSGRRPR